MTPQQLKLYELLGSKELSVGCMVYFTDPSSYKLFTSILANEDDVTNYYCMYREEQEIIGHPPTIVDLHRWLNEKSIRWEMQNKYMRIPLVVSYNSSLPLLDQTTETLDAIIELINNHK